MRVADQCGAGPEAPAWAGQEAADVLEDMTRYAGNDVGVAFSLRHYVRPERRRKKWMMCFFVVVFFFYDFFVVEYFQFMILSKRTVKFKHGTSLIKCFFFNVFNVFFISTIKYF